MLWRTKTPEPGQQGGCSKVPWQTRRDICLTGVEVMVLVAVVVYFGLSVAAMVRTQEEIRSIVQGFEREARSMHKQALEDRKTIRIRQIELMDEVKKLRTR